MKTYPKTKDSGIEWIGDIPETWDVKRLKFITKFGLSTVDRHENNDGLKVSICHYPQAYNNEKIVKDTELSIGSCNKKELKKFQLKKDDVLITKDSETPDDIGVPVYIADDLKNAVSGYHLAHLVTNKKKILGIFLFRYLQSNFVNAYFETESHGVTRFGLGRDAIGNLIIVIPSSDKQKQIASFLDKETLRIDSIVQKITKQIEKLQEYRQAIISTAITGKTDVRKVAS